MKVFICWSGSTSRQIARSIHDWLPNIIQNVEPFMSTEDIEKGARWFSTVETELQDCHFGLICLTPENLKSRWIHFEAGSLSKIIERSRVVPVLFNLEHSNVQGPLTHFQMVKFGEEEMFGIVQGINNSGVERKIDAERLKKMFGTFWHELDEQVSSALSSSTDESHSTSVESEHTIKPILEEILVMVRQQAATNADAVSVQLKELELINNELHRKVAQLTDRLTPRLRAFYDPKIKSCRSVSHFSVGPTEFDAMCYRVRVENIAEYPVAGCEGHLTQVYYEGESPELGTMSLIWAGTWPEPTNVDIFSEIPRDLSVIYISDQNKIQVCTEGYLWPSNQQDFFSRTGKYYFNIQIVGRNTAKIPPCLLELTFTGDWKTSIMRTV